MASQPPAAQHPLYETKLILRSLNFTRASEAQRIATGAGGIVSLQLLYGPVSVESVTVEADGNTKVDFVIRIRMEGDFLTFDASFEGYNKFLGAQFAGAEAEQAPQAVAGACAPYIQEIVAYVTGRAGINPIIPPLGGEVLRILPEGEQA